MQKFVDGRYAGKFLYSLGVSYHACGATKLVGLVYGYYFKVDSITEKQKALLLEKCSNVELATTTSQYAPEIRKGLIIFKSKAQINRESSK